MDTLREIVLCVWMLTLLSACQKEEEDSQDTDNLTNTSWQTFDVNGKTDLESIIGYPGYGVCGSRTQLTIKFVSDKSAVREYKYYSIIGDGAGGFDEAYYNSKTFNDTYVTNDVGGILYLNGNQNDFYKFSIKSDILRIGLNASGVMAEYKKQH